MSNKAKIINSIHAMPDFYVDMVPNQEDFLFNLGCYIGVYLSAVAGGTFAAQSQNSMGYIDRGSTQTHFIGLQIALWCVEAYYLFKYNKKELDHDLKRLLSTYSPKLQEKQALIDFAKAYAVAEVISLNAKTDDSTDDDNHGKEDALLPLTFKDQYFRDYFRWYYLSELEAIIKEIETGGELTERNKKGLSKHPKLNFSNLNEQLRLKQNELNDLDSEIEEFSAQYQAIKDYLIRISTNTEQETTKEGLRKGFYTALNEADLQLSHEEKRAYCLALKLSLDGQVYYGKTLSVFRWIGFLFAWMNISVNVFEGWASFAVAILLLGALVGAHFTGMPLAFWILGTSLFAIFMVIPAYLNNKDFILKSAEDIAYDALIIGEHLKHRDIQRMLIAGLAGIMAGIGIFAIVYVGMMTGLPLLPFSIGLVGIQIMSIFAALGAFISVTSKSSKVIYHANIKLDDLVQGFYGLDTKVLIQSIFIASIFICVPTLVLPGVFFGGIASSILLGGMLSAVIYYYNKDENPDQQFKNTSMMINTSTIMIASFVSIVLIGAIPIAPLNVGLALIVCLSYGLYQYSNSLRVNDTSGEQIVEAYLNDNIETGDEGKVWSDNPGKAGEPEKDNALSM